MQSYLFVYTWDFELTGRGMMNPEKRFHSEIKKVHMIEAMW